MLLRPGLPAAHSADWALEVKWDGMRAQLRVERGGAWCLRSRPGRDCSEQFPELEHLAEDLAGHDLLLDGELVCLDAAGRPDFHTLRRRLSAKDVRSAARLASQLPATLMVFDLLHLDGEPTRAPPYARRRASLEQHVAPTGSGWRVPSRL